MAKGNAAAEASLTRTQQTIEEVSIEMKERQETKKTQNKISNEKKKGNWSGKLSIFM